MSKLFCRHTFQIGSLSLSNTFMEFVMLRIMGLLRFKNMKLNQAKKSNRTILNQRRLSSHVY
jgi:membrane protein insertase Oxa1/YidC/SpoIIIJ